MPTIKPRPLLEAAEFLLNEKPRSAAFRRRAVSTAYYAVFHSLARTCAETLLPEARASTDEYVRVYRALDHGPLRQAFSQPPLRDNPGIRAVGDAVVRLQSARHQADYHPPKANLLPEAECRILIDTASEAIENIFSLNLADRRLLATCILFKAR